MTVYSHASLENQDLLTNAPSPPNSQELHTVSGVLLIDKPSGITSFDVVQHIRKLYQTRRVGHCGTLDPLATGLLVVLLGEATKLARYLTEEDKRYTGSLRLGVETDTDDRFGQVVLTNAVPHLTNEALLAHVGKFTGAIEQQPPRYSAKKKEGVRAYERARRGEDFELPAHRVHVHSFEVSNSPHDQNTLDFSCHVSKGTYVRSLARDLGRSIGCGAHLTELCRTYSGCFELKEAVQLDHLKTLSIKERKSYIRPLHTLWRTRPVIQADHHLIARIQKGQAVFLEPEQITHVEAIGRPQTFLGLVVDATFNPVAVGHVEYDGVRKKYLFAPERNFTLLPEC